MKIDDARVLDDRGLARTQESLAAAEREATVALILHLAEFDKRQLYRKAGCESLLEYCVEELRLGEDEAAERVAAAQMVRRFPVVVDRLRAGSLSPTTVRLIAPYVKADEDRDLIDAATGKSEREVEELLARRRA